VAGAVGAYDDLPAGYTVGPAPVLILVHVSATPEKLITGAIHTSEDRYQVSVRGSVRRNVQAVGRRVIDALHGYTSDTIKRVDYEGWPGTIREDGAAVEYHAPIDFMVRS
jgi:hypothetical protein